MTNPREKIVQGPSKFDLMIGLFDGKSKDQKLVYFHTELHGQNFQHFVRLNEVTREDGSGESWCFKGVCNNSQVRGWFRTDKREGWLEFI